MVIVTLQLSHLPTTPSTPLLYNVQTLTSLKAMFRFTLHLTNPLLADEIAVHVVGRFFAPPSGTILIDTLSLTPFLGNPCDDAYEDQLPNNTTLRITVVGGVSTAARTSSEETSRGFDLHITEYV